MAGVVVDISGALAASVTVGVDSIGGSVAFVSGCMESMPICFLNVKLRAPVATNSIGIAVLEGVLGVVDGGHEDGVKGGDTAAADCTQVNIVLESASEQIWCVVSRSILQLGLGQVHSVIEVVIQRALVGISICPGWVLNIESLLNAILHDSNCRE